MMKCVMVINENLPRGLIANTSAVLALTLGHKVKGIIGENVVDQDGSIHRRITQIPIPQLRGNDESIKAIRHQLQENSSNDIFLVDFCDVAQGCKTYDEYISKMSRTPANQLNYLGIVIYGPTTEINKLTGNIGLLR